MEVRDAGTVGRKEGMRRTVMGRGGELSCNALALTPRLSPGRITADSRFFLMVLGLPLQIVPIPNRPLAPLLRERPAKKGFINFFSYYEYHNHTSRIFLFLFFSLSFFFSSSLLFFFF